MNYYNPYIQNFQQKYAQPIQNQQSYVPSYPQYPQYQQGGLSGKMVDNIEVVKATDIGLDGNTYFFPLTDGSAIITKQLMNDGSSKMIIYKPQIDKKEEIKYITPDELNSANENLKNELEELKKKFEKLTQQFEKLEKSKTKGDK